MKLITLIAGALVSALCGAPPTANADTLAEVRDRQVVRCGISQGLPGFSNPTSDGKWSGIDIDICKGIAAATLGDADKVDFVSLSAEGRFRALVETKRVDVLTRNTTWTFSRDATLGINFATISYYDGQGFLVDGDAGITSVAALNGAHICVIKGTTSQLNLEDFFRSRGMEFTPVESNHPDLALVNYSRGLCDAFTADLSALSGHRLKLEQPERHLLLPQVIAKEPLGPVVRDADDRWQDIVRWVINAMLLAEEHEITSANIDELRKTGSPEVKRLLGSDGSYGEMLGLNPDWAYQIIRQVGNYADVYDRNVGEKTALALSRGLNALWTNGGLMYPLPFR